MCDPVTLMAIASVAGAGAGIYQGKKQADAASKATNQAAKNASDLAAQQDQQNNRLNAKQPNVAALQGANQAAGGQGVSGTMLTGPTGVDPSTLSLGKKTLLGA